MHARHRVPANGYRPNPTGIGGSPAYRNYNNRSGFGRGNQKIFQSGPPPAPLPPPPSRRSGDIFMEAGKLATEYLISKGLLPANVLNGKWQNGGDYVPGAVSGRFSDDYSFPAGVRDDRRGRRRRLGSFKNPEFDRNLETDRTGSSSAKVTSSSDKQGEDDAFSGSIEKLQDSEDNRDLESKICEETLNQNKLPDDNMSLKDQSSNVSPDESVNLKMDTEEVIGDDDDDDKNGESEKETVKEDTPMENQDLLPFIRFHKVPTRTRSSITTKGPKINPVLTPNDEKINETHDPVGHDVGSEKEQESNPEPDEVAEQEQVEHRGKKRPFCASNDEEEAKKHKEGSPSDLQEDDPCNDFAEKSQLFPDSFKICDLNSMEASNGHDNHDANSSKSDEKELEVIDLEGDSVQDDNKVFNNPAERMDETIFTDLESFPDSMQRVNEMPQDGYGLMISELLEADIPNCSGSGVNTMHDQIGLQNDEGILDDDESIYMSLGEIPISFVPVWDQQPTRGYDKPY